MDHLGQSGTDSMNRGGRPPKSSIGHPASSETSNELWISILPKLCACLELLASDKPGEVQAAAAAAIRLKRNLNLPWNDLLLRSPVAADHGRPAPGWPHGRRPEPPPPANWRAMVARCRCWPSKLTRWEDAFLKSAAEQRALSAKQTAIVERIYAKVSA
jgi:hypothetical protein